MDFTYENEDAARDRHFELYNKVALTQREAEEFGQLDAEFGERKPAPNYYSGTSNPATPTERDAVLGAEHRYSDWLKANHGELSRGNGEDRSGSWPSSWDEESSAKYWRGMTTGNWKNAGAEQRVALNEGTTTQGGYLVPSPVYGQFVDLLRDEVAIMQGMSHLVPWNVPGNTMAVPVAVTDPAIQNLNEGVDMYPPPSDVTINRFVLPQPSRTT